MEQMRPRTGVPSTLAESVRSVGVSWCQLVASCSSFTHLPSKLRQFIYNSDHSKSAPFPEFSTQGRKQVIEFVPIRRGGSRGSGGGGGGRGGLLLIHFHGVTLWGGGREEVSHVREGRGVLLLLLANRLLQFNSDLTVFGRGESELRGHGRSFLLTVFLALISLFLPLGWGKSA